MAERYLDVFCQTVIDGIETNPKFKKHIKFYLSFICLLLLFSFYQLIPAILLISGISIHPYPVFLVKVIQPVILSLFFVGMLIWTGWLVWTIHKKTRTLSNIFAVRWREINEMNNIAHRYAYGNRNTLNENEMLDYNLAEPVYSTLGSEFLEQFNNKCFASNSASTIQGDTTSSDGFLQAENMPNCLGANLLPKSASINSGSFGTCKSISDHDNSSRCESAWSGYDTPKALSLTSEGGYMTPKSVSMDSDGFLSINNKSTSESTLTESENETPAFSNMATENAKNIHPLTLKLDLNEPTVFHKKYLNSDFNSSPVPEGRTTKSSNKVVTKSANYATSQFNEKAKNKATHINALNLYSKAPIFPNQALVTPDLNPEENTVAKGIEKQPPLSKVRQRMKLFENRDETQSSNYNIPDAVNSHLLEATNEKNFDLNNKPEEDE